MINLTRNELVSKYLNFFKKNNHKIISGKSLVPENDPTVLFTTAGIHPLVSYILGEDHPQGKRLCNVQKCLRTGDIDEVGDETHLTFFEMLGNWSLGDYFKKDSIKMSFKFLIEVLNIDKSRLCVTIFLGQDDIPKDDESYKIWLDLGISEKKIFFLPKEHNFWGPAGQTGPCGRDTEIFYYSKDIENIPNTSPKDDKNWVEIWNNVFIEYNKDQNKKYHALDRKCIDTGMGVERTISVLQGKNSVYDTEIFLPIINTIKNYCKKDIEKEKNKKAIRIISDHLRTSVFILGDQKSILPSNLGQGYILRRLIRRALVYLKSLQITEPFYLFCDVVIDLYKDFYQELDKKREYIKEEIKKEEEKFKLTLDKGKKEFDKVISSLQGNTIDSKTVFKLYDTYGFPLELSKELASNFNLKVDEKGFYKEFEKHKELSKNQKGTFKGGLQDSSEETTNLHTATHILHKALKNILGDHVNQRGSNITKERLRFDFTHSQKMTPKEISKVQDLVNEVIKKEYDIHFEVMSLDNAKKKGALALFESKYDEKVKVYSIGNFSVEVCGGPHATNTRELGEFKIEKEQSSSSGVRRIKATLKKN